MIKNKKGEGGFMEAIIALMMVTVALTAFLGILAYSEIGNTDEDISLDTDFIEDLEIADGRITGETDRELERFIEKNGLNGTRLTVNVAGSLSDASLRWTVGIEEGNNVGTMTGTFPICTDDGRIFAASYEVVYWWD